MPDRHSNSSTGARNNSKHRVSVNCVPDGVLSMFTHVNSFNPYITAVCARSPQGPHFTREKTEAQRGSE